MIVINTIKELGNPPVNVEQVAQLLKVFIPVLGHVREQYLKYFTKQDLSLNLLTAGVLFLLY